MKITVLDSLAATREILDAPAADRPPLPFKNQFIGH